MGSRTLQKTVEDPDQRIPGMDENDIEPLMTVEEVAVYLRLQPNTVRGMARRGELPVVKIGRRWRFKRSLIESWLREKTQSQE